MVSDLLKDNKCNNHFFIISTRKVANYLPNVATTGDVSFFFFIFCFFLQISILCLFCFQSLTCCESLFFFSLFFFLFSFSLSLFFLFLSFPLFFSSPYPLHHIIRSPFNKKQHRWYALDGTAILSLPMFFLAKTK